MFPGSEGLNEPNRLVIRLQPDEGMQLELIAKDPGPGGIRLRPHPSTSLPQAFKVHSPDAYERLLINVVRGNATLFMRRDEVEAAWSGSSRPGRGPSPDDHPDPTRRHQGPQRRHHTARARQPPWAEGGPHEQPRATSPHEHRRRRGHQADHGSAAAPADGLPPADRRSGRAGPVRGRLACANLAHGFAASGALDKALRGTVKPNVAIVSAYNDMLSAHRLSSVPAQLKKAGIRRAASPSLPAAYRPCATASPRAGRHELHCSAAT